MTRTSNLTKSHFVTHCVQLTGAPVEVGRGAHPRKSLDNLGCLVPAFRNKDVRSEQTIRVEAPPCQQNHFRLKCNLLIKAVATYMNNRRKITPPLKNATWAYSSPVGLGTPRSFRKKYCGNIP